MRTPNTQLWMRRKHPIPNFDTMLKKIDVYNLKTTWLYVKMRQEKIPNLVGEGRTMRDESTISKQLEPKRTVINANHSLSLKLISGHFGWTGGISICNKTKAYHHHHHHTKLQTTGSSMEPHGWEKTRVLIPPKHGSTPTSQNTPTTLFFYFLAKMTDLPFPTLSCASNPQKMKTKDLLLASITTQKTISPFLLHPPKVFIIIFNFIFLNLFSLFCNP